MIPVPIFPIDFFLAIFLFLLGLLWQSKIVIHAWLQARRNPQPKESRKKFYRRKRRRLIIATLLQLPIVYYVYLLADAIYVDYATTPTLEQPLSYGDIVFPAGTQLVLHHPNDFSQIRSATPPSPIRILGLSVKSIEFETFWVTLELAKSATIEGWQCDAREKIQFSWEEEVNGPLDQHPYAKQPRFWYLKMCALAENQTYYGIRWPKNSIVERTSGKALISLGNDPRFNFISDEDTIPLAFHEGELKTFSLDLDQDLRITGCDGTVSKPFQIGQRYFAAGEHFYSTENCDLLPIKATR